VIIIILSPAQLIYSVFAVWLIVYRRKERIKQEQNENKCNFYQWHDSPQNTGPSWHGHFLPENTIVLW